MRVAHIESYSPDVADGVKQAVSGLVRHLARQDVEIELWNFTASCRKIVSRQQDGLVIYDLPAHYTNTGNLLVAPPSTLRFLRQRSTSIDLLHLHSIFRADNVHASRIGVPYLLTPHGAYSRYIMHGRHRWLKKVWMAIGESGTFRHARVIHALNQAERDEIFKTGCSCPIRVIPMGVEPAFLQARIAAPSQCAHWLYFGRLDVTIKGLDLLLRGYALARQQNAAELPPLYLIGPDAHDGLRTIQQLLDKLCLRDGVHLRPAVSPDNRILAFLDARLFLLTSRSEALPCALREALALGRPVLITPQTNMAEEVRSHGAGWISPTNASDIAQAMLCAATASAEELDRRGQAARQLIDQTYRWDLVAAQMAQLYEEILSDSL